MRHNRRFWQRLVAVAERGGDTHAEVAAKHGVSVTTLRSWIYKLRRSRRGDGAAVPRLLPVRVAGLVAVADGIAIEVGGVVVRLPRGVEPAYVASVVSALRAC